MHRTIPTGLELEIETRGNGSVQFHVEEKFPKENFRVDSEMRISGKIGVAILDFCRVCRLFSEIWREIEF